MTEPLPIEVLEVEEDPTATLRDTLRELEVDEMAIFECENRREAELSRGNICDFQRKDKLGRKFRSFQGVLDQRKVPTGEPVKIYVVRVR